MELWPNDATRRSHSKTPGAAAGRSSRDQELKGKKEEKEKKAGKGGLRQRKFETSFFLLNLLISFLFPCGFFRLLSRFGCQRGATQRMDEGRIQDGHQRDLCLCILQDSCLISEVAWRISVRKSV